MKFIYISDVHITGANPGRRKDVFYIAILKKLWELTAVIKQQKIDFVVIGGDLFDIPKVSNKLYGQVAKIMRRWEVKVFVVPGNHDLYGENIDTLEHTSLGALVSSGVVNIITRDNSPLYFQKKSEQGCPLVAITGQHYYKGIDAPGNTSYETEFSTAQYNLLVTHSMLVNKGFHPDVQHTVIDNVVTNADLVLSAHYHPERFDRVVGKTRFVKPIGTARQEATKYNIDNKPEYSIIDITQNGIDVQFFQYQTAADGKDIFDRESLEESKENKNILKAFTNTVQNIDIQNAHTIGEILQSVANALSSNSKHVNMATNRLLISQKLQGEKSLNGYQPLNYSVQITRVIIKNFQSHKDTIVEFDMNSLNALIGESDHGKTSILRAIKWVLYNEPKGDDFIRRGEKFAEVTIEFSNGSTITRRRTDSNAGSYEVYDSSKGKVETYTGFSHTIPMEVFNAHQMPKVEIGKDQVSLNIAEQLDGPFMLSQSPGDRASYIGKIIGVQVVDDAIKAASSDILGYQRSVKSIVEDIEKFNNQLNNDFTDIPTLEANILTAENIILNIETAENEIKEYKKLQADIDDYNIRLTKELNYYNQFANLDDVSNIIDKIDAENEKMLSYVVIEQDYLNNSKNVHDEKQFLNGLPDFIKVKSLVDIISAEYVELEQLLQLQYEYETVQKQIKVEKETLAKLSNIDKISIEKIESAYSYYIQLQELYTQNAEVEKNIFDTSNTIGIQSAFIKEQTKEYREILSNMGTCPICNNKLDEHVICSIEL